MNKAIVVTLLITLAIGTGYYFLTAGKALRVSPAIKTTTAPTGIKDGNDSKVVLGVFEGTIPCADCEGIQMKLTLYQDPKTLASAGFTLVQTYIGKTDSTFNEQGEWDYLRGNDEDPDATIYGLNLDKPKEDQMYFLKVGEDKVTMLDPEMNPIQSNLNYTLTKQ